jgi:hypothetical protein
MLLADLSRNVSILSETNMQVKNKQGIWKKKFKQYQNPLNDILGCFLLSSGKTKVLANQYKGIGAEKCEQLDWMGDIVDRQDKR